MPDSLDSNPQSPSLKLTPLSSTATPIRSTSRSGISLLSVTATLVTGSCIVSKISNKTLLTIFIPGYSCRASDFSSLLTILARPHIRYHSLSSHPQLKYHSYKYAALDLPGHGLTPSSICPEPGIEKFAEYVNEILLECSGTGDEDVGGETDVVLAGHSLGCRIILEAYLHLQRLQNLKQANGRQKVVGLIFIDGSHYLLRRPGYLEEQQRTFGTTQSSSSTQGKPSSPSASQSVENKRAQQEAALETLFSTMFSPHTPSSFRTTALADGKSSMQYLIPLRQSHMAWDCSKMDHALDFVTEKGIDVLVVSSTEGSGLDRRSLEAGGENVWMRFVREKFENSQKGQGKDRYENVVLEGCGHFPHVDLPERVADIIILWTEKKLSDQ